MRSFKVKRSQPSDFATRVTEIGQRLRAAHEQISAENVPHRDCGHILFELEKRAEAGRNGKEEDPNG
jgi:hypothetical protein